MPTVQFLIRTYSAGVHFGELEKREGKEVTLKNARRIWRWRGANTLNEIAVFGCDAKGTRISEPAPSIILTDAIEIIRISSDASAKLAKIGWSND